MAEDEKIVQAETVSTETTSKETETTEKLGQSQDAAFNELQEARMQQLIAEATTKALEQGKETGKREMQGAKDREVAAANRTARPVTSNRTARISLTRASLSIFWIARKKEQLKAKNIIIATGAHALTPPGMEADGKQVLTYWEAILQEKLPKSIVIVIHSPNRDGGTSPTKNPA